MLADPQLPGLLDTLSTSADRQALERALAAWHVSGAVWTVALLSTFGPSGKSYPATVFWPQILGAPSNRVRDRNVCFGLHVNCKSAGEKQGKET